MDKLPNVVPQVVYIMGTGRSGSTVLSVLLSADPAVVNAGELTHILRDGYAENRPCACGRRFSDCNLWSRVAEAAYVSPDGALELGALFRRLEWHAGFLRTFFGLSGRTERTAYWTENARLFNAIASATGAKFVVDASKYGGRALLLHALSPNRVKVVLLTRSPASILASFQKATDGEQKPKKPLAAALYVGITMFCAALVRMRLGRDCMTLRFEDVQQDPKAVLRAVGQWAGMPTDRGLELIEELKPFEIGHLVTANRIRRGGAMRFSRTTGQAPRLTWGERVIARSLDAWLRVLGI